MDTRTAKQRDGAAAEGGQPPSALQPLSPAQVATVSPDAFRRFMADFPSGVAVVTAVDAWGTPAGMTCSSLCSVSLDPPTLLVCLRRGSLTLRAVLHTSGFTVNLLRADAQSTAELFASGRPDRFSRVRWAPGPGTGGPRLTDDSHAMADCRVSQVVPGGDHLVVFGEVADTVQTPTSAAGQITYPLLFGRRRYAGWPAADVDHVNHGYRA